MKRGWATFFFKRSGVLSLPTLVGFKGTIVGGKATCPFQVVIKGEARQSLLLSLRKKCGNPVWKECICFYEIASLCSQ